MGFRTRSHWLASLVFSALLVVMGAANARADQTTLLVDFSSAVQALNKTFDPRDDQQWSNMSRFLANPDLQWIVRYSFSKERVRGIYNYLYSQCASRGSNAADMLQIIEAGEINDAGELHVLVPSNIFVELQRTLRPPKNITTLFRSAREKNPAHILVKYNTN